MRYYYDRSQVPTTYPNGSRVFRTPFPFASIACVEACPCADGVARLAFATGQPDSYFSVPAAVRVRGRWVSGFLSTDSGCDNPAREGFTFTANRSGKNAALLAPVEVLP